MFLQDLNMGEDELKTLREYEYKLGEGITVVCSNGERIIGMWTNNWSSEGDNEPHGESIIVDEMNGGAIEIYAS